MDRTITKRVNRMSSTAHFRHPLFMVMFYLILVLPHFSMLCSIDLSGGFLWTGIQTCSRVFLVDSFLENSVWALFCVILVFESLRFGIQKLGINVIPNGFIDWVKNQGLVILILLVPMFIWQLAGFGMELLTETIGYGFAREPILTSFFKIGFCGLLAFNLNTYLGVRFLRKNPLRNTLEVDGPPGSTTIFLADVIWAEKKGKKYGVFTEGGYYQVRRNLQQLENILPPDHFIRINRSAIIRIEEVADFTFWENEKYILKLKSGKEFVVTRKRILELKKALADNKAEITNSEKTSLIKILPKLKNLF